MHRNFAANRLPIIPKTRISGSAALPNRMNKIAELGDKILAAQYKLGLKNSNNFAPGLTDIEMMEYPLLSNYPSATELHNLFAWRNGTITGKTPMRDLWIKPGLFLQSARDSVLSNRYCTNEIADWLPSWYPLLSNGSAGMCFCDVKRITNGQVPIFEFDPENLPAVNQIYDSIEAMFLTILECYTKGIYFIAPEGYLKSNFSREVELSKKLNPSSGLWKRNDLF